MSAASKNESSKPGPTTRNERGNRETVCRKIILNGLTPIMFDRYAGDNQTQLEPWQKMTFVPGSKIIALPSLNIMSFLSAQNTDSAPKRILDARTYKKFGFACASYVSIKPAFIPFVRDGKPIEFDRLSEDFDAKSGVYIHRAVARLPKGIPNPKVRPVLPLPWSLEFQMQLMPNPDMQERMLQNVFSGGGIAVGLGTFRPVYGQFEVAFWE